MNSGDRILELQESEQAIELLAAQREMYTRAKHWNAAWTCVCLGVPLALTIAQVWVDLPSKFVIVTAVVVFACGLAAEKRTERFAKEAPRVQQEFDSYVYGIDFGERAPDSSRVQRFSKSHLNRVGAREKLLKWYTVPLAGLAAGEAIASCQRQNARWSESLVSRYRIVGLASAVSVAAVVIYAIGAAHVPWDNLAFLPAIIEWLCRRWDKASMAKKRTQFLNDAFVHWKHTRLSDIKSTQRAILECRLNMLLVPDWFYGLFQGRDEKNSSI